MVSDKVGYTSRYKTDFNFSFDQSHPRHEKEYLGPGKPNRKCFFCGKLEIEAPFKKEAHVIPGSLGNRYLFSNEECDNCNQWFGDTIENEFIKGIEPFRLFTKNTPKSGRSKIKPAGINSYFRQMAHGKPLEVVSVQGERNFLHQLDLDNSELRIPQNSFVRITIPKELARLGLLVSKKLRDRYSYLHNWVMGKTDILPSFYFQFITTDEFSNDTNLSVIEFEMENPPPKTPMFAVVLKFGITRFVYHFLDDFNEGPDIWPFPNFSENEEPVLLHLIKDNKKTDPFEMVFKLPNKMFESISVL